MMVSEQTVKTIIEINYFNILSPTFVQVLYI